MSNKKKTIIFISNESKLFGAPKILLNIIKYFHSIQKYNVLVICPIEGPLKTVLDQSGIPTLMPECLRDYYNHVSHPTKLFIQILRRAYDNILVLLYFTQFLLKIPNRVIYANTSVVRYVALPAIITRTRLLWHIEEYFKTPLKNIFHSLLIGLCADKIIVRSTNLISHLKLPKSALKKIVVFQYFPIFEQKVDDFKKTGKPSYDLIFAGRISLEKGVLDLLKAINNYVKINDKIKVLIIGSFLEKDKTAILDYFSKHELNTYVEFHDFDPEIDSYLLNSKVVVLPSYRENIPVILLEAVMLERPIICTNVGTIRNLVTPNKNGIIINPGDVQGLSTAIKQILDDQYYDRYLAGAKDKKKEFLLDTSTYIKLKELIDDPRSK